MNPMDQIIPGLWIGGLPSAMDTENLKANKIYSVLSAMRGKISIHETFIKHQILLDDSAEEDILIHLLPAITFIQAELDKGRGVLVHCQAGVSRSAAIVAAYLMHNRKMSVQEALELIRSARPEIDPNPSFVAQLEIFHNASFKISRKDKTTRMFYMERTAEEVMNGDGSLPSTDMFPRFPRSASDSNPPTPGGPMNGPRRRIRCKMCRQELAAREHMLDHGQVGPATPILTPAGSRRSSTNQPHQPRSSRLGSDSRPRRPSGLSFGGLGDSLTMSTMSISPSSPMNKSPSSVPDDGNDEEGEPTARPLVDADGNAISSPPLTATPKRFAASTSDNGRRPSAPRPFANISRSIMDTMSMSALDSDEDDDVADGAISPGAIKQTTIRHPPGMSTSSPSSLDAASAQAEVATNLGRRMSDAMLTPAVVDVNDTSPAAGKILKEGMILQPGSTEAQEPVHPQAASMLPHPNVSSPPLSPLASPGDLAAQLYANPKLAALRGGVLSPGSGSGIDGSGSGNSGGGTSVRQPVSPPILMNPKCSGYFVEPMKWMEPFLEAGEIAGKIVCPNKKCGVKLGNYDWAGVCCGCKEWVVPGFCISRSKVDEIVA